MNNPRKKTTYLSKKEYAPRYIVNLSRELRNCQTEAEKLLWERICKKQLDGLRFRRQHPVDNYIVDFYCHAKGLIIELDGGIHKQQKSYDTYRSDKLRLKGYTILRFKNEEVYYSIETVLDRIKKTSKSIP